MPLDRCQFITVHFSAYFFDTSYQESITVKIPPLTNTTVNAPNQYTISNSKPTSKELSTQVLGTCILKRMTELNNHKVNSLMRQMNGKLNQSTSGKLKYLTFWYCTFRSIWDRVSCQYKLVDFNHNTIVTVIHWSYAYTWQYQRQQIEQLEACWLYTVLHNQTYFSTVYSVIL